MPDDVTPAEGAAPEADFDAESAFLENLGVKKDEKEPAEEPEEDSAPEPEEGEQTPEEDGEGAEQDPEAAPEDPDDSEVTLKVGDQETKVKLSELKRAYTDRSPVSESTTALAKERDETKAIASRAEMALQKMIERAQARLKPYTEIDWLLLPQQVDAGTYQQLKRDALAANNDLQFLTKELGGEFEKARTDFMEQGKRQADEVAKATVKELSDPKTGIPNWGKDTYTQIVDYAASVGVPRDMALRVVDAASLRILHKAMLYDKSQSAMKDKVKPAAQASAKHVQSPSRRTGEGRTSFTKAMSTLRTRGTVDDAAAAFLASFGDE